MPVVAVAVYITRVVHRVYLVEAVAGMVQMRMGICAKVGRNTLYHIRVVVEEDRVEVKLRTNTRGIILVLMAVF